MKGTAPFAITMYPLNNGKISVAPFAIIYIKAIYIVRYPFFIVMCPLNLCCALCYFNFYPLLAKYSIYIWKKLATLSMDNITLKVQCTVQALGIL